MVVILQKDAPLLHKKAESVMPEDIKSEKIKKIISDMKRAMYSQDDGIAIAAPQIGISLQIFVVSGKLHYLSGNTEIDTSVTEEDFKKHDMVFFNPVIIKQSKRRTWETEGCLSVRWEYGKTHRAAQVTIEARDENAQKITRGASGLLAQIFQHEIEHLHGILFIDHAEDIQELQDPNIQP